MQAEAPHRARTCRAWLTTTIRGVWTVIEAAFAAEEAGARRQAHDGGLPNPMHQFEIKRLIPFELFGFDASFTNSALFMVIAASLITLFTVYAMRGRALVPTRLQSVAEISYEFVANMVRDNVGTDGHEIFPVRLHAVHVRARAEHARHGALLLHRDEPHHRHLRARRLHLSRRDGDRLLQARGRSSSNSSCPRACRS